MSVNTSLTKHQQPRGTFCLVSSHDKFTNFVLPHQIHKSSQGKAIFQNLLIRSMAAPNLLGPLTHPFLGPLSPLLFHPSTLCLPPHSLFCSSLLPLLFLQPSNPPSHLFTRACSAPFSLPTLSLALSHPSCSYNITRRFCCNTVVFLGPVNDS